MTFPNSFPNQYQNHQPGFEYEMKPNPIYDDPLYNKSNNKLKDKVALITGGDPLIATTHSDFLVQCSKKGIDYEVIHGSSILSSAPAISGLQGHKFGKVTTIPFPDHNFYPKSPYTAIEENLAMELHTLVLLDIQAYKTVT